MNHILKKLVQSVFHQTYSNIDLKAIIEGENEKAKSICEYYQK